MKKLSVQELTNLISHDSYLCYSTQTNDYQSVPKVYFVNRNVKMVSLEEICFKVDLLKEDLKKNSIEAEKISTNLLAMSKRRELKERQLCILCRMIKRVCECLKHFFQGLKWETTSEMAARLSREVKPIKPKIVSSGNSIDGLFLSNSNSNSNSNSGSNSNSDSDSISYLKSHSISGSKSKSESESGSESDFSIDAHGAVTQSESESESVSDYESGNSQDSKGLRSRGDSVESLPDIPEKGSLSHSSEENLAITIELNAMSQLGIQANQNQSTSNLAIQNQINENQTILNPLNQNQQNLNQQTIRPRSSTSPNLVSPDLLLPSINVAPQKPKIPPLLTRQASFEINNAFTDRELGRTISTDRARFRFEYSPRLTPEQIKVYVMSNGENGDQVDFKLNLVEKRQERLKELIGAFTQNQKLALFEGIIEREDFDAQFFIDCVTVLQPFVGKELIYKDIFIRLGARYHESEDLQSGLKSQNSGPKILQMLNAGLGASGEEM